MISTSQRLEITTLYASTAEEAKGLGVPVLGVVSLAVACAGLWATWGPIEDFLTKRVLYGGLNEFISFQMVFGAAPPEIEQHIDEAQMQAALAKAQTTSAVLAGLRYGWLGLASLTGGTLALAGLLGIARFGAAIKLHTMAAILIIVSAVGSVVGIWAAVKWGGLPQVPSWTIYPKVFGAQSAYGWALLILTRVLR